MTNWKAIEILREKISPCLIVGEWKESVDVAISALRAQLSCNKLQQVATDTISRQAAIAVADSSDYVGLSVEDVKKVTDEVVKGLKRLPSAQPEIIRCKDCIHRKKDEIFGDQWCHGRKINDDWYCADAERREE